MAEQFFVVINLPIKFDAMKRTFLLIRLCLCFLLLPLDYAIAGTPLVAHWYYSKEYADSGVWLTDGIAPATYGDGAMMEPVSPAGRKFSRTITSDYSRSIALSGLGTDDYLLYTLPCPSGLPAGCGVDMMLTMAADADDAPCYWIVEIFDGGRWTAPATGDLLMDPDGTPYSFYLRKFHPYQHASFTQSFVLGHELTPGDTLRIRCRVSGVRDASDRLLRADGGGSVYLPSHEFHFCHIAAYPGVSEFDVKRIAILGNSFTFYYASPFMLKELARSQGHRLDMRLHLKGGRTFGQHLGLERSLDVVDYGGYDLAILQDQSQQHSRYASTGNDTILADTRALTARIRQHSPDVRIILENTWAYPRRNWDGYGSAEKFTAMLSCGAVAIAAADPDIDCVSPLGQAFLDAQKVGIPDILYTDSKHPGINGAYLKTCINYLLIYGERFTDSVSDCGCDPDIAAQLRAIAEHTVLNE